MTFQEANKNSRKLFTRINLSYDNAEKRLKEYFSDQEVDEIMNDAILCTSWTDGEIAILCTDKKRRIFAIVAPGIYMELIEP